MYTLVIIVSNRKHCLLDYEFIHRCIKLAIPAHVVLVERSLVKRLVSDIVSILMYCTCF